jgi:glycosyltransferase involved in cell wall biosynthesis
MGERRLLLFNLVTDADDPILGFTHDWVRSLAARVEHVDVVTMSAGRLDVPANVRVHSVGKELGYSEPRRAFELYRIFARLEWLRGYDACFAHMQPLFALMAAPVLRLRGVPLTLWYTHPATTATLRAAVAVSDAVVTASPESINVRSPKIVAIGHGIDTDLFRLAGVPEGGDHEPFRIVAVGRIAPIKGLDLLVDAAASLRSGLATDLEVTLAGPVAPADARYRQDLGRRVDAAGLTDVFRFPGPIARTELPARLQASSVAVNLTARGGFDKSALEAMSCGLPLVTTNASFRPLLEEAGAPELLAPAGADGLAATLARVAALDPDERVALGARLRAVVVDRHSLDRLTERLTGEILFRESEKR